MSNAPQIAIFKAISTDHLPDVHQLEDRLQIFWTLAAAKSEPSLDSLTADQISSILQVVCGIDITRQRATAILEKSKGAVSQTKRNGVKRFRLMKLGEDQLVKQGTDALLIEPHTALSSRRRVENLFERLEGDVRIGDPYFGTGALDFLMHSTRASSLRVLTENIQDSGRLKRDIAAFAREYKVPLEIRVSQAGQLHDRYILHRDGMLLVGSSLKDLGRKQSMVVSLSASFAAEMTRAFDREWNRAGKFT